MEYEFREGTEPANLAAAVEIRVRFFKPDRTVMTKSLSDSEIEYVTNGTDGLVRYTFTVDEADAGEWEVQGMVQFGSTDIWSNVRSFYLHDTLPASL